MRDNFNLNRPQKGQKQPHSGAYVIDPDQLPLFPIPAQKGQKSPQFAPILPDSGKPVNGKTTKTQL